MLILAHITIVNKKPPRNWGGCFLNFIDDWNYDRRVASSIKENMRNVLFNLFFESLNIGFIGDITIGFGAQVVANLAD